MKKIEKNVKLYLIGMINGGITLGITTVIADTINSTSVVYKTSTDKVIFDELYGLADLKPRLEAIENHFIVSGSNAIRLWLSRSGKSYIDFRNEVVFGDS